MDLAASIQAVTEEVDAAHGPRTCTARPGMKNLVLAGGVALNCVANGRLLREGPFERLWIQPAAGDAGGALGAALFVWHQLLDKPRQPHARRQPEGQLARARGSRPPRSTRFLAPSGGAVTRRSPTRPSCCEHVAGLLAEGKVVGWFQGRMEFGPRPWGAQHPGRPALAAHAGAR